MEFHYTHLVISAISGIVIAIFYHLSTQKRVKKSVLQSIAVITLVSSIVVLIIGDSLAKAVGLFGALAMIRFRTNFTNPLDLVIIFLSIIVGMTIGSGYYMIAVLSIMVIPLVILGMGYYHSHFKQSYWLLDCFSQENWDPRTLVESEIAKKLFKSIEIIEVRSDQASTSATFQVVYLPNITWENASKELHIYNPCIRTG